MGPSFSVRSLISSHRRNIRRDKILPRGEQNKVIDFVVWINFRGQEIFYLGLSCVESSGNVDTSVINKVLLGPLCSATLFLQKARLLAMVEDGSLEGIR
jgi:hypothetical protein